jgi:hypothetical protein
MHDTKANQRLFPQPKSQKKGCGFPQARLVGGFSLHTGAWRREAHGPLSVDETALFRQLAEALPAETVVLTDRYYSGYGQLQWLQARKLDFVMRKNARRQAGSVRRIRRLAKGDWLVAWSKSDSPPEWMTPQAWAALPEEMLVREVDIEVSVGGLRTQRLTVVTSLLDAQRYPAKSLRQLYRRRWQVETHLDEIKTTMGMDILRCKSPAMIEKELLMHRLAYNLVRLLMLQASVAHTVAIERISFHGSLVTIRAWAEWMGAAMLDEAQRAQAQAHLLAVLVRHPLAHRPDRSEPRCRKRRPKNYQLMTRPRKVFKEIPHRNRYGKSLY